MASIEYMCRPMYYDFIKQELVLKIDFITPEMQRTLEELTIEKKPHKFKHTFGRKDTVSDQQRKFYYAFLHQILVKQDILPTGDNLELLDEEIRKELFPIKEIQYGENSVPRPKRMKEMCYREQARVLKRLTERYSYLNIEVRR